VCTVGYELGPEPEPSKPENFSNRQPEPHKICSVYKIARNDVINLSQREKELRFLVEMLLTIFCFCRKCDFLFDPQTFVLKIFFF
jgi:hypothetical protein